LRLSGVNFNDENQMIDGLPFVIDVPSQHVCVSIKDSEALKEFVSKELAFFQQLSEPLSQNVVVANTNYGTMAVHQNAERALSNILSNGLKGQFAPLTAHLEQAEKLEVLIAHGCLGEKVRAMITRGDKEGARWLVYVTCSAWTLNSQPDKLISAFRGTLFASPAIQAFGDLTSSASALENATKAREAIDGSRAELVQFIDEKTKLFDTLEDLYRNKLTIEEPAVSWKHIAERKTKIWITWLAIFSILVIGPIVTMVFQWPVLSEAVAKLTATTGNGSFSFAGFAIVSIPALLYAWLLKNVSRIFIQNLNLADDAAHRRSLALTYMGLLQNEKHPASDPDRAIILNALFRPIPPQTADEGPPSGLIDLIRK
jgi:hypothetical protein